LSDFSSKLWKAAGAALDLVIERDFSCSCVQARHGWCARRSMAITAISLTLVAQARRVKMGESKNLASRALAALIAGRERQAQLYVERFERTYPRVNDKLTKR
jgi:hypothetical protein